MAESRKSENMRLSDLLIAKLQALYDTENELIKALPKMARKADDPDLRASFEEHLEQTKEHVQRLEDAFSILEEKPKKLKGEAIRGLVNDASWVMQHVKGAEALDANLIAAAQYAEHYEMAGYGSARQWAEELGQTEIVDLLQKTLDEEKETDQKLSDLAMSKINGRAR